MNKKIIFMALFMMSLFTLNAQQSEYVDLGLPSGTYWKKTNESGFYNYSNAVSKFGNKLPSRGQFEELKNECEWTWTGRGYKVVGPNGNSIMFPAAGYRSHLGNVYDVGTDGYYWSSTKFNSSKVCVFFFDSGKVTVGYGSLLLNDNNSVRLVKDL